MVEQARARNAAAIESGRVDLRRGSVESLPFDDDTFDKALAINSMQVWPDPRRIAGNAAGHETWRQNRARLYALFGTAERGIDANTHGRGLYGSQIGEER
jgi:hypothetical protein